MLFSIPISKERGCGNTLLWNLLKKGKYITRTFEKREDMLFTNLEEGGRWETFYSLDLREVKHVS